jgi:methylated-DNA-protein-cysteine methyltransferase-like protein
MDDLLPFRQRVFLVVADVPPGRVTTYGDVAAVAGSPRAARQVGYALASLPVDTDVPWQRVINAQGRISFRGDDLRGIEQQRRLQDEGVVFTTSGTVDLDRLRWDYPDWR